MVEAQSGDYTLTANWVTRGQRGLARTGYARTRVPDHPPTKLPYYLSALGPTICCIGWATLSPKGKEVLWQSRAY
jgi:hypothetical protein